MHRQSLRSIAATLSLFFLCGNAIAADPMVVHNQKAGPGPYADSVVVPPGYTSYYIAGVTGEGKGTAAQTATALAELKGELSRLGLTFGDVVQAHVFMVGDPARGGKMDYAGMNSVWLKEFGTPQQPNKPARVALRVAELASEQDLIEIEFIAVKRVGR